MLLPCAQKKAVFVVVSKKTMATAAGRRLRGVQPGDADVSKRKATTVVVDMRRQGRDGVAQGTRRRAQGGGAGHRRLQRQGPEDAGVPRRDDGASTSSRP